MKTLSATSAMRFPSLLLFSLLFSVVLGACSSKDGEDRSDPLSYDAAPPGAPASQSRFVDLSLDPVSGGADRISEKPATGSAEEQAAASRTQSTAVVTNAAGAPPAHDQAANWASIGASVVDGESSTYNPPPPAVGYAGNRDKILTVDVATGAIDARTILNETIVPGDIAADAVTTVRIADGAVTNPKIADNAVTSRKSNSEVVNEPVIQYGTVSTVDVGDLQGGTAKLDDRADARLNSAVTAPKIITGTVTVMPGKMMVTGDTITVNNVGNEENTQDILPVVQQIPKPEPIYENGFRAVEGSPYSTFSIDVDNAAYSNVRGYLSRGTLPPANAVRIEELVNYFDYNYPDPAGEHPFAFHSEVVNCPWNPDHLVVRLALQGKRIQPQQAAASNLVFLIDVSGSMSDANKLPLLKQSFLRFVDELRPQDRVAIVVYAGAAGLVLESTPGSDKKKIKEAIDRLQSGGSTAGGAGIRLAYKVARDNYISDGINRVILATDGDFNVGVSSDQGLVGLIEEERKDGVFLSILGFGTGNYQDEKMEKLADNGNGNYYYIDKEKEGKRVLVDEMSGTLFAIAKDVKLQIKFNPAKVAAYRLIGYENRALAAKDFDNDAKDAGELGAGHTVTALYEVVPVGSAVGFELDTTKGEDYQLDEKLPDLLSANDLLLARLRYKEPTDSVSKLIEHLVRDERVDAEKGQERTRFALAVAEWGMILRGSKYVGSNNFDHVLTLAKGAIEKDSEGYRKEFVELVEKAKNLAGTDGAVGTR